MVEQGGYFLRKLCFAIRPYKDDNFSSTRSIWGVGRAVEKKGGGGCLLTLIISNGRIVIVPFV